MFKKICVLALAAFFIGHMMFPVSLDASKKSEFKAEKKKKKKKDCGCGCGGNCKKK